MKRYDDDYHVLMAFHDCSLWVGARLAASLSGSEWWFWEICALLVGFLGTVPLAAHVAANQFIALTFMRPGRSGLSKGIPFELWM